MTTRVCNTTARITDSKLCLRRVRCSITGAHSLPQVYLGANGGGGHSHLQLPIARSFPLTCFFKFCRRMCAIMRPSPPYLLIFVTIFSSSAQCALSCASLSSPQHPQAIIRTQTLPSRWCAAKRRQALGPLHHEFNNPRSPNNPDLCNMSLLISLLQRLPVG
jgi:hypothetical protein